MGGPSTYIIGLIALASCQAALAGSSGEGLNFADQAGFFKSPGFPLSNGYYRECGVGKNFTDPAGVITSPGFPIAYQFRSYCDWYISPNKTSVFYMRSLTFQTLPQDIVTIRVIRANAGSMAIRPASFSGMNTTLSVAYTIEPGDVIWVRFLVDDNHYDTVQGFRLAYTTPDEYPADSYQCPDGTCLPAPFKCDGVNDCLDGADELPSTCADGCSNDSLYHCADGQCVAGSPCNGIASCNDQSDEGQGCFVSEDIVEGDSLTATVPYQRTQQDIRVAVCSDDLCEAINMYGQTSDGLLAYESYAHCNIVDRRCDGGSLVNFNYPSGWTAFSAASWQFWVSLRDGYLSVSWNNASSVDATVPVTSPGGKRLLIYPLATTTWLNRPTENPSSLSTESGTNAPRPTSTLDPAYASTTTSTAPVVSTVTTPASTTTTPTPPTTTTTTVTTSTTTPSPLTTPTTTTPVTTPAPTSATAPTTTPTTPASTLTPASTSPTTPTPTTDPTSTVTPPTSTSTPTSAVTTTTSAPTHTSPGRSTVTTPQPAATTTSPAGRSTTTPGASSPAWISSSTPAATTSDPTPIRTTTVRPTTPSPTTSSPGFPTPPTPGWPPVPAPPACPLDLPLRYQYLLVPVEGQPQLYVICFAGWGQSMRCPQPLAFSYAQQKCVWSWNARFAAKANKA